MNSNEPMVDYNPQEQPQEQVQAEPAYAYQQFQTDYSTVGQDINSGYAYNNYGSGYTNIGGTVIDSNGKELKNRFGLKLTFSILEMLCCCTSCITLIMGIIACVFTCKANNCYKESRYEEFKSKAKTSTILLIVGGVFAAIAIIINAVTLVSMSKDGFWDEFMYEYERALEEELGTDVDMNNLWEDLYEGEYNNLYDESLEGDDYYSDYIEGVYHLNTEDSSYVALSQIN